MEFRTIDGVGNNLAVPGSNAAGSPFTRLGDAHFAPDGTSLVEGPNPRTISNIVVGEGDAAVPNGQGLSGMMYAWGQFIDHDMTRAATGGADISILVPNGDPDYADGTIIPLTRNLTDPASGNAVDRVTAWLDGSVVYGSDATTAASLRLPDGRMATSEGDNLPISADGTTFLAGDNRVGENPSLTSLQILFVREHNRQVDLLRAANPSLTGDELYDQARAIVGAEIAHITYAEFLPHLLGRDAIPDYAGYDPNVDPRISVEFSGAAYRWGHSTVSAETERKDETGALSGEAFELRDVFFMPPASFAEEGGAGGFLRHLGSDLSQAMDVRIVDDLRNFLFDPPVGSDLAVINIQRARDLGLGSLNQTREVLGLTAHTGFAQLTDDAATVAALQDAYDTVDAIDLWTGGLAERLVPGAFLGETFRRITADQFAALRDGDRLFYLNQGFDAATLAIIQDKTLSDLIRLNTDTEYYQDDAFVFAARRAADVEGEHLDLPQLVVGTAAGRILTGGTANDTLAGGSVARVFDAAAGGGELLGGRGDDLVLGGENAEILRGGRGDDTLSGGAGADTLSGGAGVDAFLYKDLTEGTDLIRDFASGQDRIDLSAFGIGRLIWLGNAAFTEGRAAEARLHPQGGDRTRLMLDLDGDGSAELTILFRNTAPAASDLIL